VTVEQSCDIKEKEWHFTFSELRALLFYACQMARTAEVGSCAVKRPAEGFGVEDALLMNAHDCV